MKKTNENKLFSWMPLISILIITAMSIMLCGCGQKKEETIIETTGTIIFTANGEDFVRQGFVDKQGWSIFFDTLYVNIEKPTAYMPEGEKREALISGEHWIDLAAGDRNAKPIRVGTLSNIKTGNYQSLKFNIKRASFGLYRGYSIVMMGKAVKDDTVPFTIYLNEEMGFDGKEGFVGDEIKGMVKPGGTSEVEMTFHFDHIFGDKEAGETDHINTGSVGFDFFNQFNSNGKVVVSQSEMREKKQYSTLIKAIWTLGHLGEGHCEVSNQSSAGIDQ